MYNKEKQGEDNPMKKKKTFNKAIKKRPAEEVAEIAMFMRRGSRIENKKGKGSYNRQKFKKGE